MSAFSRRRFIYLLGIAILSIPGITLLRKFYFSNTAGNTFIGKIHGVAFQRGHQLLRLALRKPYKTEKLDVLIIGSGISGLSAGREIHKAGISNFKIIDIEDKAGGNSKYGNTKAGKHPWGAHYLPIPSPDMEELISFLKEIGIITGENEKGLPVYDDRWLCHEPEDRLYIHGFWQSGLIPDFGVPESDKKQIKTFLTLMDEYKNLKDQEGKYAFDLPVSKSSTNAVFLELDKLSMKDFLIQKSLTSSYLHWYVDYCCKDDFGTGISDTSAWAGIHYYASRKGKSANAESHDLITWPEGNGWLMDQLKAPFNKHIDTSTMAYAINENNGQLEVSCWDIKSDKIISYQCKQVVLACPQFVIKHMRTNIPELSKRNYDTFTYSTWLVANMTIKETEEKSGVPLAWDNVIYNSPSLGYINSSNQNLNQFQPQKNFTYYRLLESPDNSSIRKTALKNSAGDWIKMVNQDLKPAYPDLQKHVSNYDIWVWGHAMIKPLTGFLWHSNRTENSRSIKGKIHFAHTDLSGLSLFEEGFYQGIAAADKVKAAQV